MASKSAGAATKKAPPQVKSTSKAVEKKKQSADLAAVPAYMRDDIGKGTETLTEDDIGTPRLKLMQGLSPELDSHNDLSKGDFFHVMADENLGPTVLIVPVFRRKQYILWRPRESGGGILARADDGIHWQPANAEFEVKLDKKDGGHVVKWKTSRTVAESGLDQWGSMYPKDPNMPPAATLMYNVVCAFIYRLDLLPAVFTFQRAGIPDAKKLHGKMKSKRVPIFGQVYEFTSVIRTNSKNQNFHGVEVTPSGWVPEDQYGHFKQLYEQFESMGVNIRDLESLQGEGEDLGDHGDQKIEGQPDY